MRRFLSFIVLWACIILQSTLFKSLSFTSVAPNLVLVTVVSCACLSGQAEGMLAGFIGGLVIDAMYGEFIGFYALLYLLVGYFTGISRDIFFERDIRIPIVLVCVSDFAVNIIVYALFFLFRGRTAVLVYLVNIILPELVYTAIMTLPIYRLLYAIHRKWPAENTRSHHALWSKD